MTPIVRRILATALASACVSLAHSADIAGIPFDDTLDLDGQQLTLNGAGVRTRFFFKIYAMGLYLPEGGQAPEAAISSDGRKRIRIVTLRDLTSEQFADGLVDGIRKNHDDGAYRQLENRVQAMRTTLLTVSAAPEGTEVILDFLPAGDTRLHVGGKPLGDAIPGTDFQAALLRVWLGKAPADAELKSHLAPGG